MTETPKKKLGGRRPGSGRPKGAQDRRTKALIENAKKGGLMPLDYMLSVMRNKKNPEARREAMAVAAAPYLHPRLQAIQHSGDAANPMVFNILNRPPKEEK